MQRNKAVMCALIALLGATMALAQGPPMPKPGPEQQRLQYFVGHWKNDGEMKPGIMGPGGKFSGTDEAHMIGGFFLAIHSNGTTPMGPAESVAVMGYDPKTQAYTYDEFNSMGMHDHAAGHVSGKTWTWNDENEMGGKKVLGKFTMTEVSPTSYTYKLELSDDNGKTWKFAMDGKDTKIK